ncbi:MAG: nuclear transport factor 2 family protein [Solirubrobacteraceae bacterium]
MSSESENVEIVRRALNAKQSEFAELLDPGVRLDLSERIFNPAVYEGYAGIMQWRAEVRDVWESYVSDPQDFFDGGQAVVVLTHERGRGRGSGVEVDRQTALLFRLHDRRVSEIRLYHDRERAMRDAGVAE